MSWHPFLVYLNVQLSLHSLFFKTEHQNPKMFLKNVCFFISRWQNASSPTQTNVPTSTMSTRCPSRCTPGTGLGENLVAVWAEFSNIIRAVLFQSNVTAWPLLELKTRPRHIHWQGKRH